MKNTLKIIALILSLFILSGCPGKSAKDEEPQPTKTIQINHVEYRTGNAQVAELGSVGYVSGLGWSNGPNLFIRGRMPEYEGLKIANNGIVTQSFLKNVTKEYKLDVEGKVAELVDANVYTNGNTASDKEKQVSYHLLSVKDPDDIVVHLNNFSNKRSMELMKTHRKTSRFITQIIVAYGYKASTILESARNSGLTLKTTGSEKSFMVDDISIAKAKLEAELGDTTNVTNEVSLSDGIIVGYTYDIACWGKANNSDDTIILTSIVDRYGHKQKCPIGVKDPDDAE